MTVVVEDLAWGGIAVIKIVFVLLLGWACMDEASDFANEFAGSGLVVFRECPGRSPS